MPIPPPPDFMNWLILLVILGFIVLGVVWITKYIISEGRFSFRNPSLERSSAKMEEVMRELLREIRMLRREIAELRKEMEE